MKNFKRLMLAALAATLLSFTIGGMFMPSLLSGQAGTAVIRPSPPYWEVLGKASISASGLQIPASGSIVIQPRKRLRITIYIKGYTGGGETAALIFNEDTGNNYKVLCTTTTDGITWAPGGNNASPIDRIRIAPSNATKSRNVEALVVNDPTNVEKTVGMMITVTGTGTLAQNTMDLCNGGYVAAGQITKVRVITTTASMFSGSSVVIEGSNF